MRYRLKFDGYVSRQPGESETRIFFSTPSAPENFNLIYKFSTSLREFKTSEKLLESICSSTKHMLLRNEVVVSSEIATVEIDKILKNKNGLDKANVAVFDYLQAFIAKHFVKDAEEDDDVRRVEVKIEATPTIEQLKELMEYSSDFPEDGWPDVIFIDKDDNRTSIKKHRIVERIKLSKTLDAYSCSAIHSAVKDNRKYYIEISKLAADSELEEKDQFLEKTEG